MPRQHIDNFETTIAGTGITTIGQLTVDLASGQGARLSSLTLSVADFLTLTITNGTDVEIVYATARTVDQLTIVREREGSTARTFPAGSVIGCYVTAQTVRDLFDTTVPDYLTIQTADMVATTDRLGVQARRLGGRAMLQAMGPSGLDYYLQPLLMRGKGRFYLPAGNSTTITAVGAAALTATGTATAANVATTNVHTYQRRLEYLVTVAAATAVAGFREAAAQFTVGGTAAGLGGFQAVCVWGPATGVATTTNRGFCGMANSTAAPTDVEPSTITNIVGMGWDAADTNIQIMHRGAGAVTKIDLGASFPVPTADRTSGYELYLFSPPGTTQSVSYLVINQATGARAEGTITTNLPSTSTFLAARGWMSVGGTSSVIGVALMGLALDSDF